MYVFAKIGRCVLKCKCLTILKLKQNQIKKYNKGPLCMRDILILIGP